MKFCNPNFFCKMLTFQDIPLQVVQEGIVPFLNWESLVALKMVGKLAIRYVELSKSETERLRKRKAVDTYRSLICAHMNTRQVSSLLEERCFVCEKRYNGGVTIDLMSYGHRECIFNLLVSVYEKDENGDVPADYLPTDFPALENEYVFGRLHPKIHKFHTLEGYNSLKTDLPKVLSPMRGRKRRRTKPPALPMKKI